MPRDRCRRRRRRRARAPRRRPGLPRAYGPTSCRAQQRCGLAVDGEDRIGDDERPLLDPLGERPTGRRRRPGGGPRRPASGTAGRRRSPTRGSARRRPRACPVRPAPRPPRGWRGSRRRTPEPTAVPTCVGQRLLEVGVQHRGPGHEPRARRAGTPRPGRLSGRLDDTWVLGSAPGSRWRRGRSGCPRRGRAARGAGAARPRPAPPRALRASRRRSPDDRTRSPRSPCRPAGEVVVADRQGRHEHDDVAERAYPDPVAPRLLAHREARTVARPTATSIPVIVPIRRTSRTAAVVGQGRGPLADEVADACGALDGPALGHEVEVGDRGGAAQRVGRVGVAVEEGPARRGRPEERVVDRPRWRAQRTAGGSRRSGPCRR